jgi:microsomal epoxide hydrolase
MKRDARPARRRLLAALGVQALAPRVGAGTAPALGALLSASLGAPLASPLSTPPSAGPVTPPAQAGSPGWQAGSLVTSDGVRISLLEQSPPVGPASPTIVLVPGWCMPATIWRGQLAAFGARWNTVAMDPRGQGDSAIPAGGYTADRRADDLHEVLQSHERVVLVAWSLGVLEALQYVQRHGSGRLAGLALVDNSIGEPPAPRGSDFLVRLRHDRRATMDRFVRSMFKRPPAEADLVALRESALRMPLESSIALLSYPLPREHWRDIVHAFDRPLAYLVTPHLAEQARHLQQARPASRVEIFEGAGHALFVDAAERFNAVMVDWISGLG